MSGNTAAAPVRSQKLRKDYTRTRLFVFSALVAALLLVAVFADRICPYDPNGQDLANALQAPGPAHLLGTDRYGRDMLSRVLVGARTSIFSALLLVAVIAAAGTLAGILCGYFGGAADAVIMRIADICLAFPGLVFAMAIAAVLQGGIQNAVLALAAVSWPKYARLARGQTLSLRQADYIHAARLAGSSPGQMILRHVLPNIAGPVLVTAMLDIGTMMMELAALSFLGLGAQPPTAEWGSMISVDRSLLQTYPWVVLSPGLTIFVSVVLFNLLGDAVRDCLDPRGTGRKQKKIRDGRK
ncbi:MAG TPA: ABC transporter permease [Candidatus Scatomonas pullistercoris]|uniref:ABC transporter permease n=1 Tax=Candidatus Scatomonas pullistercoris TaxID=2840920 RepID=A0A9D1P0R9_9FIRM|nr:ABC transporter permease [Candidatus Scatomonas pullistercoris]